ncbi:DNA methyltransferase [uncultured Ilyobacter sp.]|uniref:TRM11 family SAM-dependent methyltransferase n=1 Tax=uncultured Ilyobacter sp. TaxID=544433 RepID=UPI0029C66AFD|nr:DNA methyltransferase [uncultured Ilyobacter sp.]
MKDSKEYLYVINYPAYEEELCMLEMRALFGREPESKVLISQRKFNPSNSIFIKKSLEIIYEKDTLQEILDQLEKDEVHLKNFKSEYLRLQNGNVSYEERIKSTREVGLRITGNSTMTAPETILGVTKYNGKWFLGINKNNDCKWHLHETKPCSYSNSLSVRLARVLVNIASKGDQEKKVIDPCCGVGTTLVEGLSMGHDISGYEINPKIVKNAKENLRHFNLETKIIKKDMHDTKENYDASIIDIPYGLFSHTTEKDQQDIINTARRISKRMVMVSFEILDEMVLKAGFEIIDRGTVTKGTFKRYILVCQ